MRSFSSSCPQWIHQKIIGYSGTSRTAFFKCSGSARTGVEMGAPRGSKKTKRFFFCGNGIDKD